MYFGEGVGPIKAPQSDEAWEQLFQALYVPPGQSPTDKIIAYHKQATSEWSAVRGQQDREAVRDISGFMQNCVEAAYAMSVNDIASAYRALAPHLGPVVPQLQAARVRETEDGKMYSILLQIRDIHGRSLAIFENGMSIPVQSAVMIEVVTDVGCNKVSFFVRSSPEAFQEDLTHAERMLQIDGEEALGAPFRPLTFRIIQQILSKRFGEEAIQAGFISEISLEVNKEEGGPAAIAHVATRRGKYRVALSYNPQTCGPMAILSPESEDRDWNANPNGE